MSILAVHGHERLRTNDVDEGLELLAGTVTGNLVVLDGDLTLRSGAVVRGDALVLRGRILDRGGVVRGERRSLARTSLPEAGNPGATGPFIKLAGLAGVVLTLSLLGFGLVLFAKPQLEVVSDTVTHSLFRSFLTGLLAQVVAIPTAGLLVVGLVLSVVGILLLIAGIGLLHLEKWAWILAILACVGAIALGFLRGLDICGWILAIIILVYLILVRDHFV